MTREPDMTFSRNLKEAMLSRNMTPHALAARSGVPYTSVLGYLKGKQPTAPKIRAMCVALRVSADKMLGLKVDR
jgi:transcriptional regulator with XRE-family HTH domain